MSTATKTRERPILFSGPMVRAILDDRKTQTRRVIRRHPLIEAGFDDEFVKHPENLLVEDAPYKPGDILWVRETWQSGAAMGQCHEADDYTIYRATDSDWHQLDGWTWRPSIYMPRERSRLFLRVTAVRVERVQDISEADAIAEGFDKATCAEVFSVAAGKSSVESRCWLEDENGESSFSGDYCKACATKERRNHRGAEVRSDCGIAEETDGPAVCELCGVALLGSLSDYGISRELFMEEGGFDMRDRWALAGPDALVAHEIATGMGDLREHHMGRLAQIGFATYFEYLNASRGYGWGANPWVWVYEFERVREYPA